MSKPHASVLRPAGLVLGSVLAVVLTALVAAVVYGVTAEYGAGAFGSLVVPTLLCLTPVAVTVALWRTTAGRRLAVLGVALAITAGVMGGAAWAGERANRHRLEHESASFSCDGFVDPRVDRAFARLPRPALIYGPLEASHTGCTAGIAGGRESYDAFRVALLGAGWHLVSKGSDRTVMRRGGLLATLTLDEGVQPMLHIELDR
ncbi:hypothetical protein ACT8ZV_09835 [Nocardioides sp. MAHUQ-72]|uniref:hypothetical protein n=1 Tax=unclassified Nocardioides TaxID=2615069 RepID=UPI0036243550